MSLRQQINDDIKKAMKAGEKTHVAALRLITAALKQKEIDTRTELNDAEIIVELDRMLKQRKDSYQQYQQAGREDLAKQEKFEIEIIQAYLPEPLSDAEIDHIISKAITDCQASSMKEMGKVMSIVKPQVQGRADMAAVSQKIKAQLN